MRNVAFVILATLSLVCLFAYGQPSRADAGALKQCPAAACSLSNADTFDLAQRNSPAACSDCREECRTNLASCNRECINEKKGSNCFQYCSGVHSRCLSSYCGNRLGC